MTYRHLFFDLDNTLLDFDRSQVEAFTSTCHAFGLPSNRQTFHDFQIFNHHLWQELEEGKISKDTLFSQRFSDFFKPRGFQVDGPSMDQAFRQTLSLSPYTIPNAHALLETLKQEGFLLYAASNGAYDTQIQRLNASRLMPYFDRLFISGQVGYEKPSIYFFNHVLSQIGNPSLNTCLMIGDRLSSDIQGAINIGMDSVWFNPHQNPHPNPRPTFQIQYLLDLLPLLDPPRGKNLY